MIESLKPYPGMKASGIPWLGDVPESWELQRVKALVDNVADQTQSRNPSDCFVALENVESWTGKVSPILGKPHFAGTPKRFTSGDVLYGKLRPYLAKVALAESPGGCVGEFLVLRAKRRRVIPAFLALVLRSPRCIDVVSQSTFGAKMPRADWSFVGGLRVALPPVEEQNAIVDFLNNVNERIDKFIAAKRALISLLGEQEQTVIDGVIGLHWGPDAQRRRIKSIARVRYGLGQPPPEDPNGVAMIRATNICRGRISGDNLLRVDAEAIPSSRQAILAEGEIIVVRSGAYTADSALVTSEFAGAVAGYDMVLSPDQIEPEFLQLCLLSRRVRDDQLIVESLRSAQPHLNAAELGCAVVPLPSRTEQHIAIADVERQTAVIREA